MARVVYLVTYTYANEQMSKSCCSNLIAALWCVSGRNLEPFVQVEVQLASLNQHDARDATPLYYASFVGNHDMVQYLLSKGAKCEEKVTI
jgi:ankyrin repeat protein